MSFTIRDGNMSTDKIYHLWGDRADALDEQLKPGITIEINDGTKDTWQRSANINTQSYSTVAVSIKYHVLHMHTCNIDG